MRKETKVFWCVDYPRLRDSLLLRLHRVREVIAEQVGGWGRGPGGWGRGRGARGGAGGWGAGSFIRAR